MIIIVDYDQQNGLLHVGTDAKVAHTVRLEGQEINLDYDQNDHLVGVEFLDVSEVVAAELTTHLRHVLAGGQRKSARISLPNAGSPEEPQ